MSCNNEYIIPVYHATKLLVPSSPGLYDCDVMVHTRSSDSDPWIENCSAKPLSSKLKIKLCSEKNVHQSLWKKLTFFHRSDFFHPVWDQSDESILLVNVCWSREDIRMTWEWTRYLTEEIHLSETAEKLCNIPKLLKESEIGPARYTFIKNIYDQIVRDRKDRKDRKSPISNVKDFEIGVENTVYIIDRGQKSLFKVPLAAGYYNYSVKVFICAEQDADDDEQDMDDEWFLQNEFDYCGWFRIDPDVTKEQVIESFVDNYKLYTPSHVLCDFIVENDIYIHSDYEKCKLEWEWTRYLTEDDHEREVDAELLKIGDILQELEVRPDFPGYLAAKERFEKESEEWNRH